jgi:hypothetical protein
MNEQLKPLEPGDEVYIRGLEMFGKVLNPHKATANEPDEERLYTIQITRHFRRADLVLYDKEVEREKRDATRRKKMERLTAVSKEIGEFLAAGGDINSSEGLALGLDLLKVTDGMRVEFGHNPLLLPINDKSTK